MLSFLLLQPKYKVTLWQTNKTSDQATEASANGTAGKAQISEGRMCTEFHLLLGSGISALVCVEFFRIFMNIISISFDRNSHKR